MADSMTEVAADGLSGKFSLILPSVGVHGTHQTH